jgi:uncharacterized membrane protein YeaQ/YmgE (transglycosylase-associated protein family)
MDASAANVILWGVVGAVIGWLAGQIMEKGALGGLNDVLAGLAGAVIGGFVLPAFFFLGGQQAVVLGHIVNASLGAVIGTFAARFYMEYQTKSSGPQSKGR